MICYAMHMHMQCICFEKMRVLVGVGYACGISVFGDYSEEEEGEEGTVREVV